MLSIAPDRTLAQKILWRPQGLCSVWRGEVKGRRPAAQVRRITVEAGGQEQGCDGSQGQGHVSGFRRGRVSVHGPGQACRISRGDRTYSSPCTRKKQEWKEELVDIGNSARDDTIKRSPRALNSDHRLVVELPHSAANPSSRSHPTCDRLSFCSDHRAAERCLHVTRHTLAVA